MASGGGRNMDVGMPVMLAGEGMACLWSLKFNIEDAWIIHRH